MQGIPFIGEGGFYPSWARHSGRWLFQRTLIALGGPWGGMGQLHAAQTLAAQQILVWCPAKRSFASLWGSSKMHEERQRAREELDLVRLVCYNDSCDAPKPGSGKFLEPGTVIEEQGIAPEKWVLRCSRCRNVVGPDLAIVNVTLIVRQWFSLGKPPLENPGAGPEWQSAPVINDLEKWSETSDPSHLELAYVGQQMWPNLETMWSALEDSYSSKASGASNLQRH